MSAPFNLPRGQMCRQFQFDNRTGQIVADAMSSCGGEPVPVQSAPRATRRSRTCLGIKNDPSAPTCLKKAPLKGGAKSFGGGSQGSRMRYAGNEWPRCVCA